MIAALIIIVVVIAALWLLAQLATLLITRAWPPIGTIMDIDGLKIHVVDQSAGDAAPTLLLIHGASGNLRDVLLPLQPALGDRFRLIAVDRPGNGHSERGPRAMSDPRRQADLVTRVLDRLDVSSCLVLGHSWGATIALPLAEHHPDRVNGLLLLAPAAHPLPNRPLRIRFFASPILGRVLAELLIIPVGALVFVPLTRYIFSPDRLPPRYLRRVGAMLAIRPATYFANCCDIADASEGEASPDSRPGLPMPVEIVMAERDHILAPAIHGERLARRIPAARVTVLKGSGHCPHWSRTEAVVAAIERLQAAIKADA